MVRTFFDLYGGPACLASAKVRRDMSRVMDEYRKRCFVPGKDVLVIKGDREIPAYAEAVDEKCRLLVRYEDGTKEALSTGEVSLKVKG